jgi:hypothetical protein
MDIYSKIAQQIKGIAKDSGKIDTCLVCTVTSVSDTTCNAEYDGFELEDIRLYAVVDTSICLLKPKVGSKILVSSIDGAIENLYVIKCQDYETVRYQVEQTSIQVDSQGVMIQKGNESLRALFLDLISLVKSLKLATPAGPTTQIVYPTAVQIQQLETRVKDLLK